MSLEEEIKKQNKKREEDIKMVKKAHEIIFHRELWINKKIPFAKEWLLKHDKEWFEKNKDHNTMKETFNTF
jgi:hypothetical protein